MKQRLSFLAADRRPNLARSVLSFAVIAALLGTGCSAGTPPTTRQLLASPTTSRQEHEIIADGYIRYAAEAREWAERHREMARRYEPSPVAQGGAANIRRRMVEHCEALVANFEAAAASYDDLAESHRQLASEEEETIWNVGPPVP